jgi:hypothetical protein
MSAGTPNTNNSSGASLSRRGFFSRVGDGVHGAALASLLNRDLLGADASFSNSTNHTRAVFDQSPLTPHFEPRAKSVIHFFMNGGPSQVDLLDPKPTLEKFAGSAPPRDIVNQIEFADEVGVLLPSPYRFSKCGQSGMEISELMPHLASVADEITLIRSMHGEHFNHEPSLYLMHSGRTLPGRASLGSWVVYGLGSENQNLPGYVVLDDPKGYPVNDLQNWQSGFLPPVYQGTKFRSEGPPILNLKRAENLPNSLLQAERDILQRIDEAHQQKRPFQPQLDARMAGYELAARMQLEATDALDLTQESQETLENYGIHREQTRSYGTRCLMARRLIERGVRYIQIFIEYQIWDNHFDLDSGLRYACGKTDQPVSALLKDLKQRGLLDSTLLMWGGEFGRMPLSQVRQSNVPGRDHGPAGFSLWMAGGGVKGGYVHGATDEIGHKAIQDRVSVHDYHATMLHLLGLDSQKLTYPENGLDLRLTDQYPARVIEEILA